MTCIQSTEDLMVHRTVLHTKGMWPQCQQFQGSETLAKGNIKRKITKREIGKLKSMYVAM